MSRGTVEVTLTGDGQVITRPLGKKTMNQKTTLAILSGLLDSELISAARILDLLIMGTPTSETRNKLTIINLQLMQTQQSLEEYRAMPKEI